MLEAVTLDQLRTLIAVADAGGFTAASRRLSRAQSAVSHAVAQLELQLDLQLFDRSARRPVPTPAGEAVLAEARGVIARADRLRARARGLAAGLESEVAIALSVIAPPLPLASSLAGLAAAFPSVAVRVAVEEIGGATERVARGEAHLGVIGRQSLGAEVEAGLEVVALGAVRVVGVAAPDHPLAAHPGPLGAAEVADHRQIAPSTRAAAVFPLRLVGDVWEVADLGLRRALLAEGLGWGLLPEHAAAPELAAGRLVRLPFDPADGRFSVALYAVHRADAALGPARRWLLERWREGYGASAGNDAP
ncbi:MAG: LysR family transcriptional regulator [Paracoccaceae bacterium]